MNEDTGLVRSAVAYPFGGAAGTRLVFGAVLYFFGAVVSAAAVAVAVRVVESTLPVLAVALVGALALLPVLGYVAATVRAVLEDEPEPPAFGDPRSLVRDGRRVAVVLVAYAAPAAAAGAGAVLLAGGGSPGGASLGLAVLAAGLAVTVAYVLPAAVVAVVYEGAASAAWNVATIREAVVDRRYAAGWLVGVLIALVGGAIGAVSAPFVVGFAVLFVTQVAVTYAVTRGVIAALDLALEQPPAPPASGYVPGWDDGPSRKELSQGRLGGSLLPTTSDGGEQSDMERNESSGTSGPVAPSGSGGTLARTDDGGSGTSDLDRSRESPPVGGTASADDADSESTDEAGASDLAPFVDGDDEIDTADGREE